VAPLDGPQYRHILIAVIRRRIDYYSTPERYDKYNCIALHRVIYSAQYCSIMPYDIGYVDQTGYFNFSTFTGIPV